MAITPTCDKCGQELTQFGAILLSPPNQLSEVKKLHLCVDCYHQILADLHPNTQTTLA